MATANRTCSIDGCEKNATSRGWCSTHYSRWKATGTTERPACKTCGGCMDGKPRRSIYCSAECKLCTVDGCTDSVGDKGAGGLCPKHYQRKLRTGSVKDKRCKTCHKPLEASRIKSDYCSAECRPRCKVAGCETPYRSRDGYCAKHKRMMRKHGVPTGAYEWTPKSDTYDCQACGTMYKAGAGLNRRFCSGRCQRLWHTYKGNIPSLDFDCAMCGKHFERDRWDSMKQRSDKKLCDQCRRSKGKRHRSSVGYLAKRDGTNCGICGNTVDMNLRHPDPMSPSVDHITPVALGGSNNEGNLQLSHLTCNLTKQARADYKPA